jgi:hypothetical protein
MREPLWRRKVVRPFLELLRQGLTPEKIAFTIALGITLGVTPVVGFHEKAPPSQAKSSGGGVLPLHWPPFPYLREVFGTARSSQWRAGSCAAQRTLDGEDRSGILACKGKGAGVSGGFPLAGVRGSAPRT